MKHTIKVILLIALGIFLLTRLLNGTLSFYIHPRFNVLTLLTAVGLIGLGIAYAIQQRRQAAHNHAHDETHDHDHEHEHVHSHDVTWAGLLLLAIPVVLGLLVEPRPLGASALQNREINIGNDVSLVSANAPEGSELSVIANAGERNILDWLYLFQRSPEPTAFDGQEAHVVGFVYRDDRFAETQFMVSRFTVSCCVADAAPIGLIVEWPDTAVLAPDSWVEVSGTVQARTFNGVQMPVLVAESITPTETPSQPYLYQ
ncbi:TIGR03943 family putative permease subunit [Candidatus Leptofilum sp.]|uniref:TIGR03943 family putative permease subunit n=1 Tax=Candidatus Leptofilum sp. TaxID=3241576 RepID=UPI003B5B8056